MNTFTNLWSMNIGIVTTSIISTITARTIRRVSRIRIGIGMLASSTGTLITPICIIGMNTMREMD
jgi:hypothetical protein